MATLADDGTTIACPAEPPDTAATAALSAALAARPVAELAEAAEISKSAASRALIALEKAGLASRHLGGFEGAKRMPDRWQMGPLTETAAEGGEPAGVNVDGAEAVGAPDSARARSRRRHRRPPGQPPMSPSASTRPRRRQLAVGMRGCPGAGCGRWLLDHLRSHPTEDFTPFAIGRELGQSSGAVANACDRLTADGAVLETSQKPRRVRFAG